MSQTKSVLPPASARSHASEAHTQKQECAWFRGSDDLILSPAWRDVEDGRARCLIGTTGILKTGQVPTASGDGRRR